MNNDPRLIDVVPALNDNSQSEEKPFATRIEEETQRNDEKASWWPNCVHPRYTKLAVRKFRDRIVILWKCRRCPKEVREVIDIDMNSREVFIKSTKSPVPRKFDPGRE